MSNCKQNTHGHKHTGSTVRAWQPSGDDARAVVVGGELPASSASGSKMDWRKEDSPGKEKVKKNVYRTITKASPNA